MDILFWTRCSPKITVEHTTKKFYGKYLYKIVVYCPAGRLIDAKGPMDQALEHRLDVSRHITMSWWQSKANKDIDKADVFLLDKLRVLKKTTDIKIRIEEPRVQIYAATEDELVNFVIDHLQSFVKSIETISGPANEEAAKLLDSGAIIRKIDNGYTHKVILRDGRYGADIKDLILNYLDSLQVEVAGVPKSCRNMFEKTSSYVWNCYFFTNDPSVTIFLDLIQPGIVSNIHELVIAN